MQSIIANHMRQQYGIELKAETEANKSIETQLKQEKRAERNKIRILVLGTGDSGKSTFIKQMIIKHAQEGHPFNTEQLNRYKQALQRNVLETIQTLLEHTDLDEASEELKDLAEGILALPPSNFELTPELSEEILIVWNSSEVQATFKRRGEFHSHASAEYFMNNAQRFAEEDFAPQVNDIIHCREVTRGIKETRVISPDGREAGKGQKGGSGCTFLIIAQLLFLLWQLMDVLEEDDETNRLHDSLKCLAEVSKNPSLKSIPFMVFLNKHDLFTQKIGEVPLTDCFPDYEGDPHGEDDALAFLKQQVQMSFKGKHMYPPHLTCAIDTNYIGKVWEACEEILRNSEEEFANRVI